MSLTPNQIEVLLRPIRPGRVATREGLSNVEAYDIRAHLTRVFGFANWSLISPTPAVLLYEQETTTRAGKPAYKVAYRATMCLSICDRKGEHLADYYGSAVGESVMPDFKRGDAHDMALKTAESQAMKRAAINLGDQFGLSLYAKGATGPLVGKIVGDNTEMHEPDVVEEVDPDTPSRVEDVSFAVNHQPEETSTIAEHIVEIELVKGEAEPLPADSVYVSDKQIRKIQTLFGTKGIREREAKLAFIITTIGRDVASSKEMTLAEANMVIDKLEKP